MGYTSIMDPNLAQLSGSPVEPAPPPKDLKTQISETSGEFVKDNYEGFLHKLVNIIFAVLKFLKNSVMSMINMAFGRE
jgi:hypothetical protein